MTPTPNNARKLSPVGPTGGGNVFSQMSDIVAFHKIVKRFYFNKYDRLIWDIDIGSRSH